MPYTVIHCVRNLVRINEYFEQSEFEFRDFTVIALQTFIFDVYTSRSVIDPWTIAAKVGTRFIHEITHLEKTVLLFVEKKLNTWPTCRGCPAVFVGQFMPGSIHIHSSKCGQSWVK